jgi:hypothetical protein
MRGSFHSNGKLKRERKTACKHCGAMRECDLCWEHVSDWSPFGVWHCLLCRMPQAIYHPHGAGMGPTRCDFCGWDEKTECTSSDPALMQGETKDVFR